MGVFSNEYKTYVSSTITNMYTQEAEEMRFAHLAILEATIQDTNVAQHVVSTQLGANGVKYRNYCYWAKKYKFSGLHDENIGDLDYTWTELLNYYEPQVSASPEVKTEDMQAFLAREYGFNPEKVEHSTQSKLVPYIDKTTGQSGYTSLSFKTYSQQKYNIVNTYCGKYFYTPFGEAYLWSKEEYFEKFNACIYTGDTTYNVVLGYGMQGEDGSVAPGTADDIYIQFGYTMEEDIELVEGEGVTTEKTFYATDDIFVPIKQELGIQNNLKYLCLAAYIYEEILEEQYEKDGDVYVLDNGELIPTGEYIAKEFEYEYKREGVDGTLTETYTSTIDIESVIPVGLIKSELEIKEDPLLANMYEDPGDVQITLAPPICFKHDKSWINEKSYTNWYYRNKAVCRKIYTSFTYYNELIENLYDPCSNGDIGWVYLLYGLPTNMVQLDYCARYALQFFKQLTISDWASITPGMEVSRDIGGRSWQYGSHTFNFHFNFAVGGISYRSGVGKCPVKPDCRRGECSFAWYGGQATLWRQWDTDAWEYLIVRGYSTTFMGIKNGKNGPIGSNGWTDAIWKNEETEERNYSKAVIPISAEIAKNIPITNWTDLTQYIGNIGVTSYKVVKIRWYQKSIFKVIVVVVMIVVTIVVAIFAPYALPATMMTFGTMVGVGALLINLLIYAAVSFAVAIVCNSLLKPILVDLLGEFWGNLINTIVIIVVSMYCCNISVLSPTSWTTPQTLGALWNGYVEASIAEINADLAELQKEQQATTDLYNSKYEELAQKQEASGINLYSNSSELLAIRDVNQVLNVDMTEAPLHWVEEFTNITIVDEVKETFS